MKKTVFSVFCSASFGMLPVTAAVDCIELSLSVKVAVAAEQSKVLEIVSSQVAAAPDCACETVKAAIEASNASAKTVAAIVEAAAVVAPEQMRLVSQCAVAVAPDSLAAVQAVVAKLDPNSGESGSSAKSAKSGDGEAKPDGEVDFAMNPLDFPGRGPVGPAPGGPGGSPLLPNLPPAVVAPPDPVNLPEVTNSNP